MKWSAVLQAVLVAVEGTHQPPHSVPSVVPGVGAGGVCPATALPAHSVSFAGSSIRQEEAELAAL